MNYKRGTHFLAGTNMRVMVLLVVMMGIASVCFAQEADSARMGKDPDSLHVSQPAIPGQQDPEMKPGMPFSEENAVKLQREEVPLFLQKVLQSEEFRGWENGNVYRNIQTQEYRVDVVNGMKKKTYYFDKNGTLLKMK